MRSKNTLAGYTKNLRVLARRFYNYERGFSCYFTKVLRVFSVELNRCAVAFPFDKIPWISSDFFHTY